MAGRQMQEDLLRERWRSNRLSDLRQHPASDDGVTVSGYAFFDSVDALIQVESSKGATPLVAMESTEKGIDDYVEGYDAAKGDE